MSLFVKCQRADWSIINSFSLQQPTEPPDLLNDRGDNQRCLRRVQPHKNHHKLCIHSHQRDASAFEHLAASPAQSASLHLRCAQFPEQKCRTERQFPQSADLAASDPKLCASAERFDGRRAPDWDRGVRQG